jgi:pyruvate/2-oxoglutarate dehydrogenase complex dihydrolipoamide dehydrogenase (E3) component
MPVGSASHLLCKNLRRLPPVPAPTRQAPDLPVSFDHPPEETVMAETFDVLVIGGGQAGIPLAQSLAKAGQHVALAERRWLGGSCVNFGCTPTKAAIASARVAYLARHAAEYGVNVPRVEIDFPGVLLRAKRLGEAMRADLQRSLDGSDNPRLIGASARFLGRDGEAFRLGLGDEEVLARQVVLDTGTHSAVPPIAGIDSIDFIDSENWLEHRQLPKLLLMIGGGYIGLEMGQFYARMGSQVAIIESGEQIVANEDRDVADALKARLEAEGVCFQLNARVRDVAKTSGGIELGVDIDGKRQAIKGSDVFLALGREPNTEDLGLETVGVRRNAKGMLEVDARLSTNVPGIWAAGDIRGGPMFTHAAWDDYRIIKSQLLGDHSRSLDRVVPYAIFTDPEVGRVGLNEKEAKAQGRAIRVGRFEMQRNGKARELGETTGFIKVIVDAHSEQLLGATLFANEASELVHLYVDLMKAGAPYTAMRDAIHIHPTLAEAAQSAVASLQTIH